MKRNPWTFLAWALAALPLAYVLSFGPVYGYRVLKGRDLQSLIVFYSPIVKAVENSSTCEQAAGIYLGLWIELLSRCGAKPDPD